MSTRSKEAAAATERPLPLGLQACRCKATGRCLVCRYWKRLFRRLLARAALEGA